MIELDNYGILEICATVIAGALIFLTLSTPTESTSKDNILDLIQVVSFGLGVIMFFSYSAVKVLNGQKDLALKQMRRGFLFLFVMAIVFLVGNFLTPLTWLP